MNLAARAMLAILGGGWILLGAGILAGYQDLRERTAAFITRRSNEERIAAGGRNADQAWGLLAILLGMMFIASVLPGIAGYATLPLVVAYFVMMMTLGWRYTSPERRVLGPTMWLRRALLIPAAAFFISSAAASAFYALSR